MSSPKYVLLTRQWLDIGVKSYGFTIYTTNIQPLDPPIVLQLAIQEDDGKIITDIDKLDGNVALMICNVALMAPDGETQLSLIKVPLKGSKYSESPSNSLNDLMTATGSSISHSTVSTSTPSTASTTTTSIPSQHSTIGSSHPYHSSSSSSSSSSHQQHVASSSVITAAGHPLDSIDENTINRSSIVNTPNSSGSRLPPPYTNTSTPNSLNASSLSKDHPQQRERRRSSQMTSSTTTPTSSTISSSGSSGSLPSDPYSQSILVKSISKNDKFQDALLGTLISTCHLIRDVNSSKAAMFVFWDLAIRAEGRFRLTFTVSQISTTAVSPRAPVETLCTLVTDVFECHKSEDYPSVPRESTPFTKLLAEQGLKIPIRNKKKDSDK